MNEISELWRTYRKQQQERRANRLPIRTKLILSLTKKGHKVEKKTAFQYRIDGFLDLYPIHCRFHNIKTNKRSSFNPKKIEELIKRENEQTKIKKN